MTTFVLHNFGCRATHADAAAMRHQLLLRGFTLIEEDSEADLVVLNTCTVTAAADAQAREAVRKIHRENPAARIVITGCYAQRAPQELAAIPGVELVLGNSHQSEIARLICDDLPPGSTRTDATARPLVPLSVIQNDSMSLARGPAKILTGDIFAEQAIPLAPAETTGSMAGDRTRPILKIQDGCNNRCSYCVIPFVRGNSRSLAPAAVVEQVRRYLTAGAREIVLSGINLGSYGRDLAPRADLASIVRRILEETEIEQIRFSSIEPQDVTRDFIELVASSQRIAPHFHVPMQSGSNKILRAMRRWYRAEHYAERIKLIRATLPHAAIGPDVIVGFPGESEEDFEATIQLIMQLPFTYLHVFSFSPRPGTEAANLKDAVPNQVIRTRARTLRALSEEKLAEFRASQSGRRIRALTLHRLGDHWTEALTGNYLKVRIAGRLSANEWHDVTLPARFEEVAPGPVQTGLCVDGAGASAP